MNFLIADTFTDSLANFPARHVSICTMHLAKGLQFRAIVVMACDDEINPFAMRGN